MAGFIGAMLPIVLIVYVIYLCCVEHKRNKELDKLAQRNRDAILGRKYWKD